MQTIKLAIKERQKIRAKIADGPYQQTDTFLLISEAIDDYIEYRIETDKVLAGILSDIQGNLASIAENSKEKL